MFSVPEHEANVFMSHARFILMSQAILSAQKKGTLFVTPQTETVITPLPFTIKGKKAVVENLVIFKIQESTEGRWPHGYDHAL